MNRFQDPDAFELHDYQTIDNQVRFEIAHDMAAEPSAKAKFLVHLQP